MPRLVLSILRFRSGVWAVSAIAIFLLLGASAGCAQEAQSLAGRFASPKQRGQCQSVGRSVVWDGVTDDSAAMKRAIAGAVARSSNGGACVRLPTGTGVLCNIDLPAAPNGLSIVGSALGATMIKICKGSSNLFNSDRNTIHYLEIGQITIVGDGENSNGAFLDLSSVFSINLHNIVARGGWNFANLKNDYEFYMCNTDLRNFRGEAVIRVEGGADFRWCAANNYDDDQPSDGEVGSYITVQSGGGIVIDAVDAIHCGSCYIFRTIVAGDEISWVFLTNTMADTCNGNAWTLDAAAGTTIKGFQGIGIWGASCAGNGLAIGGAGVIDGVSLIGPRLQNNGENGALLLSGEQINIMSPTISGNGSREQNKFSGLAIGGRVKRLQIIGGAIGQMMGYDNHQSSNIFIKSDLKPEAKISILGTDLCNRGGGNVGIENKSLVTIEVPKTTC